MASAVTEQVVAAGTAVKDVVVGEMDDAKKEM